MQKPETAATRFKRQSSLGLKSLPALLAGLGWITMAWAAEPKPINVTVGEEFKIELESDFSTGCQWLLYRPLDEKLLKVTGKPGRRPAKRGATVGVEVLTYKALAPGKTQVHLKYDRLWEKTAAPLRLTNVVVVISPATAK